MFPGADAYKDFVIGGQVCMWAEFIDETNLEATLWPRANSPAEKLWSSSSQNDWRRAEGRFENHRCRMIRWVGDESYLDLICVDLYIIYCVSYPLTEYSIHYDIHVKHIHMIYMMIYMYIILIVYFYYLCPKKHREKCHTMCISNWRLG